MFTFKLLWTRAIGPSKFKSFRNFLKFSIKNQAFEDWPKSYLSVDARFQRDWASLQIKRSAKRQTKFSEQRLQNADLKNSWYNRIRYARMSISLSDHIETCFKGTPIKVACIKNLRKNKNGIPYKVWLNWAIHTQRPVYPKTSGIWVLSCMLVGHFFLSLVCIKVAR